MKITNYTSTPQQANIGSTAFVIPQGQSLELPNGSVVLIDTTLVDFSCYITANGEFFPDNRAQQNFQNEFAMWSAGVGVGLLILGFWFLLRISKPLTGADL